LRSGEATGDEQDFDKKASPNPSGICFESFDMSLTILDGGILKGLAVRIKGKTDKVIQTLTLWPDTENKEFCPLLHLQAYLYLIKFKGIQFLKNDKV
jgi:hypothetical protein